jgi:hypothetical protein
MKMPGFTAEASLYKIDEYYHGILIAPIDDMQVLPQFPCHQVCLITCGPKGCHKKCHWVCGDPITRTDPIPNPW